MLVAANESKVKELAECYGTRKLSELCKELARYDAMQEAYRVTVTRHGAYWYIHAYIM